MALENRIIGKVFKDKSILKIEISRLPDPVPDGLGDQISQFGHVEDHADARGGGHENSEDGLFRGP